MAKGVFALPSCSVPVMPFLNWEALFTITHASVISQLDYSKVLYSWVCYRIYFNVLPLSFKALCGMGPGYLRDSFYPITFVSTEVIWSACTGIIQPHKFWSVLRLHQDGFKLSTILIPSPSFIPYLKPWKACPNVKLWFNAPYVTCMLSCFLYISFKLQINIEFDIFIGKSGLLSTIQIPNLW